MSSAPGPTHQPSVGEDVMLLVHTDDRPIWTTGSIASYAPFSVEIDPSALELLRSVGHLIVIHDSGRKYSKGEGSIGELAEKNGKAWIRFNDFRWESVDNRDNPRFDIELKAGVRAIREHTGGMEVDDQVGLTKNISLGGTLLQLSSPISKGQLVEFRASLPGSSAIRAMGVVAHVDESQTLAGINFIDYIGSARYTLHQYLRELAA